VWPRVERPAANASVGAVAVPADPGSSDIPEWQTASLMRNPPPLTGRHPAAPRRKWWRAMVPPASLPGLVRHSRAPQSSSPHAESPAKKGPANDTSIAQMRDASGCRARRSQSTGDAVESTANPT
jgi:hypothetical protein